MENTYSYIWGYGNICPKCGKPYVYIGDIIGNPKDYVCMCHAERIAGSYGWICPICGTVNAPWVSVCLGNHTVTTTTIKYSNLG